VQKNPKIKAQTLTAAFAASRAIHQTPFEHHRRNQGGEHRLEKK
jgi:hypothetical protein